ncbi:chromosome segregation protein SMC [Synergistales bacterium]|nr:chromosome segregation protein SMC [Synergistales bacterium]
MIITQIKLKNWKNFLDVDVPLHERTYLLGANASGKSNLLDVFRFLRDVSKSQGGGLQKAIHDRGGIKMVRCLHARKDTEVKIEVSLAENGEESQTWRYVLAFKSEPKGEHRVLISSEEVYSRGKRILHRPDENDKNDPARLTQTAMEQIQANSNFRDLVKYFEETTYLHLVPQLLKFNDQIGGQFLEGDPFGQGFLERVARTPKTTRDSRLEKIGSALSLVVPHFHELHFIKDDYTGRPHLEAKYAHHRPNGALQREDQFSDGTLRLIALLWVLYEGDSLLLLEEPELSLNNSIVQQIPILFQHISRNRRKRTRQILTSTHSEALLSNTGIDPKGVLLLESAQEGTRIRTINEREAVLLKDGFSISEAVLSQTALDTAKQLSIYN